MITGTAHLGDGYVTRFQQTTWGDARNAASGTNMSANQVGHAHGAAAYRIPARTGGFIFSIYRSFFNFDTSQITKPVESATIKIHGFSENSGDIILAKATPDIAILGLADFNAIDGWDYSLTTGAGHGTNVNNITIYSVKDHNLAAEGVQSYWSDTSYNNIVLSTAALSDIHLRDNLYVCLLNYTYDVLDIVPTDETGKNGFYYADSAGGKPILECHLHNAVFMGTNF